MLKNNMTDIRIIAEVIFTKENKNEHDRKCRCASSSIREARWKVS